MRLVEREADLLAAAEAAAREANAAFSDARVFLEKYVAKPRHVEVQIFGDQHGQVIHLNERECSIQRRHQKLIEETPSPGITPQLRKRITDAAVDGAAAIGYTNAGTMEFLVDEAGDFYFLEVNARLQVEHPVTELTARCDLVRLQIEAAAGLPLSVAQSDVAPHGHAIECRICAEDAARNFVPSIGTIARYVEPGGPGVRVDSGVTEGSAVTVHYDPMLAKLIVWAPTRDAAIARMKHALRRFVILGVTTNIGLLAAVLRHRAFVAGDTHTHFLDAHAADLRPTDRVPDAAFIAAALAASQRDPRAANGATATAAASHIDGPWNAAGHWRAF
jgi:acetyl/propionyl-CoA carboxylase alpha subunit